MVDSSQVKEKNNTSESTQLFVLLTSQPCSGVRHFDRKLVGSVNDLLSLPCRDIMSNLSRVTSLQHQQKINILNIVDDELTKAIRHHVSCFGVASVTDAWHEILSLESSSNSAVDTLGFSPTGCNFVISLRLVTDESFRPLLDDDAFCAWNNHCVYLNISDYM